jgi:hypothetical protein
MLLLKSIFISSFFICFYSNSFASYSFDLANNEHFTISDTIVVIIKKDKSEIRGILVEETNSSLLILLGDEQISFLKSEIVGYRFITSNEIKSKSQFESPNHNYTKYCFYPSAFTTKRGESSSYSHYLTTANLKVGLTDNWEFSLGSILINSILSSVSYSKPIYKSVRAAISIYGGYIFYLPNNPGTNQSGIGIIPRISFGDENQNISMGLIASKTSLINQWVYGSYLGAQQKLNERWTLSGEFSGLTVDSHNILLLGDVTLNVTSKREFEVISFGILGINTNSQSFIGLPIPRPFIPLPYLGYQRIF